jgi:hypothetical protein
VSDLTVKEQKDRAAGLAAALRFEWDPIQKCHRQAIDHTRAARRGVVGICTDELIAGEWLWP